MIYNMLHILYEHNYIASDKPSLSVIMGDLIKNAFFLCLRPTFRFFFFILKFATPGCPKTVTKKTRVPGPAMSISDAHRWAIFTHPS